ncbi:uncharacterized protein Z519_11246 [Cladophialophora bantiana CBS 173.52]|uniref:Xylanolytic transcriptional activator regulatory domain-containing protein n=1 Tax=Cladophialophora bantiana (strain ATCC 10958 / CBS 173.52 / CDC B-1940 / NIH 8579) TaxID=1442370 RepID=A0A0D2HB51_CLAB1|nr:uncharacterized protein Z519_11246 [Cladophialophora bantiana CBS 173.52]KIW88135.1 hypothetical protein Z519_11246 [Cladophialophora bantiana CBS 173.52]
MACVPNRPGNFLVPEESPHEETRVDGIRVHSLVQSETGMSIHGPASAFHVPTSARSGPSLPSTIGDSPASATGSQPLSVDQIRQELFAFSALEFQKEYTYMVERKIDFDGLDWEVAHHLLELHWNHHHLGFMGTYRPAIMHSLATHGPHCNKLLLNALFYSASLQSSRPNMNDSASGVESYGARFFRRFQSLLATEIQTSTTTNIAALTFMGSACVSNGKQTIGWLFAGIAYRMIVDMGLHIDPNKLPISSLVPGKPQILPTSVDLEIQRRYIWGAYLLDRFQSLYFGRPPGLNMIKGLEPSLELLDTYEELELWKPYVDPFSAERVPDFLPQPSRAQSTRTALIGLATIASEIIERFYTPKVGDLSIEDARAEVQLVLQQLSSWEETLPTTLRYEPGDEPVPPPIRFNLHTTFSLLHILLHRPFLREGHLEALSVDEGLYRGRCVSAALRIYKLAKIYREVFTLRRATYLFSYAVFSAATIIPQHSVINLSSSECLEIVVFFWNALKELQNGANFGLRKPITIIKGMFERAGIDLNVLATMQKQGPHNVDNGTTDQMGHTTQRDQNLPNLAENWLDGLADDQYRDLYNEICAENIDWSVYVDDVGANENDELLYGLFRSGREGEFA